MSSADESASVAVAIGATAPFDFELSAQSFRIFSEGDPAIRRYDNGLFCQVLRLRERLVLAQVRSVGSVEAPLVSIEARSNEPLGPADLNRSAAAIRRIFDLDLDLGLLDEAVAADPLMASIVVRLRGLRHPLTETVFEALVSAIVGQQISLTAAHHIEGRLVRAYGGRLDLSGGSYFAFPTPEALGVATPVGLRSCGLSRAKAEYVHEVAKATAEGSLDLEGLKSIENLDELLGRLYLLRGVGPWTAELTAVRGLRRFDALPADDVGLQRSFGLFYFSGRRANSEEVRKVASHWGRWRGLGAFYLLVAYRLGLG